MKLHRSKSASEYLAAKGVRRTENTLAKLRVIGGGPEFRRIGGRDVAYEESALDAWVEALVSKPLRSTSEAA